MQLYSILGELYNLDFDSSDQRNGYIRDAESSQGNKKHFAFCDEVVVCTQKDNKQGTTLNGIKVFMKSHLILIFQNLSQIYPSQFFSGQITKDLLVEE